MCVLMRLSLGWEGIENIGDENEREGYGWRVYIEREKEIQRKKSRKRKTLTNVTKIWMKSRRLDLALV